MIRVCFLAAALAAGLCAQSTAPFYSHDSIVNAATNTDFFAPNVIATMYGTFLAWSDHSLTPQDVAKGYLPTRPGGEVEVLLANSPVGIYYVHHEADKYDQINFLIPASLRPGDVDVRVVRQGVAGPLVKIKLLEAAPSLMANKGVAVAQHADGTLVSADSPAHAGEWVVLYALGLGPTIVRLDDAQIPLLSGVTVRALGIQRIKDLRVLVNGETADASRIWYAGLSPGSAGLYQINFQLPDGLTSDAEIRIALGDLISPAGLKLPVR